MATSTTENHRPYQGELQAHDSFTDSDSRLLTAKILYREVQQDGETKLETVIDTRTEAEWNSSGLWAERYLPTLPGWYVDQQYRAWQLDERGTWWLGGSNLQLESVVPRKLTPIPVTKEKP